MTPEEKQLLFDQAANENPWFTADNVSQALLSISQLLNQQKLEEWANHYSMDTVNPKRVGVVMAGNIPMVGFHDLLCVLISGHHLMAKLSSGDTVLMKFLIQSLVDIHPSFANYISVAERLNQAQAVIATGSDNTSRYFEYYFRNIPHIIRKNRTSCAVILGEESRDELLLLGKDVFSYFGLGCRNVSKVFVPDGFDFALLIESWHSFQPIIHHHKYANNYDYQKSILLINQVPFFDSGFSLITENKNTVSPISVMYYETYANQDELNSKIQLYTEKIQCIVAAQGWFAKSIPFGNAQLPEVNDYADGVDTMKFLQSLSK